MSERALEPGNNPDDATPDSEPGTGVPPTEAVDPGDPSESLVPAPHHPAPAPGGLADHVDPARAATDLEDDMLWYGAGMHPKLPAFVRLLLGPFFARVRFSEEAESQIRNASEQGVPVYVMRTASLLTFLYLNFICIVRELPLARFVNGIRPALWAPFDAVVAYLRARWKRRHDGRPPPDPVASGHLSRLVAQGNPALVFVRRRDSLVRPPEGPDPEVAAMAAVVAAQRGMTRPIFLIPQVMVWSRRPDRRRRTFLDVLLGSRGDPGPFRQLGRFLLNHRHASLVVAEPLNLQTFLEQAGRDRLGNPRTDQELGRMLRRLMLIRFGRELRVVRGPDVRPRHLLIERILRDPEVQRTLVAEARRRNVERRILEKRVRRYLRRISADISVSMVDLVDFVLQRAWTRMYDDVVVDSGEIERVRALARRGTVVLVPCHKSHIDYLLVSDILYARDIAVPHVAAGINLSFWPLGPIFRRIGAFFVQRTFKDDRISPVLIKRYIAGLLWEGHSLEFFIEGGRSRTGLLLPPKLGLLSMIADQVVASRSVQETVIVPVAIGYDRVAETAHYAREAQGNSKTPESLAGVLRSVRVLKERFGTVTVRFLEPIPLRATLSGAPTGYREDAPWEEKKAILHPLGNRILVRIARATPVAVTQIVAAALLNHNRRGILEPVLLSRVETLTRVFQAAGLTTGLDGSPESLPERVEAAVGLFMGQGCLSEYRDSTRRIFAIVEERRLELDYYRNSALTAVAPGAILACVIQTQASDRFIPAEVYEGFAFLVDLFRGTFVFDPDKDVGGLLDEAVEHLVALGVLERVAPAAEPGTGSNSSPPGTGAEGSVEHTTAERGATGGVEFVLNPARRMELEALGGLLRSHLEAVLVAVRALGLLRHEQLPEKLFLKRTAELAQAMYMTEEIGRREATNIFLIRAALARFERMEVFTRVGMGADRDEGPRLVLEQDAWDRIRRGLEPYLAPVGRD